MSSKMHIYATSFSFWWFATSIVTASDSCCFHLSANGGPGGPVGQIPDGQNRIGQGLNASEFCISNGAITDQSGRGCILTPPTTQLQCDTGASPTGGFSIACNGSLTHDNSNVFWSCPTEDHGGYNIYTTPPSGQQGCVPLSLCADNCRAPPPPASSPAASLSPSAAPKPAASSCPTNLKSTYEFPHLIIPASALQPNKAYGTSYNGTMTPDISSVFKFDIPSSYANKQCSFIFLLPLPSQLQTSAFSLTLPGTISFSQLAHSASIGTGITGADVQKLAVQTDFGTTTIKEGSANLIGTFACPVGGTVGILAKSVGGTALDYFQDYNESPIGAYITVC